MGLFDNAGASSSWLDMLARNPRGWGNLAPEPEAAPQAIFDEWGQPHHGVTGKPLYGPDPTLLENLKSLGELPARTVGQLRPGRHVFDFGQTATVGFD